MPLEDRGTKARKGRTSQTLVDISALRMLVIHTLNCFCSNINLGWFVTPCLKRISSEAPGRIKRQKERRPARAPAMLPRGSRSHMHGEARMQDQRNCWRLRTCGWGSTPKAAAACKWIAHYKKGNDKVDDEVHIGRSPTSIDEQQVNSCLL